MVNFNRILLAAALTLGLLGPAHAKDIEDATCFSETASLNVCASPDGWSSGQPPSAIYANLKELMAGIKRAWDRDHATIASTGSADAYVLTYTAAPAAYVDGQRYSFRASFANTGSATANVNTLGDVTIQKQTPSGLTNLAAGDIFSGQHVELEYDSGAGVFILLNAQAGSSGGSGTVTSISAGTGLSGGTITGAGTISLTAPVTVPLGGTGTTTLSAHDVLLGNGTSAVVAITPDTAGYVLTSNGAGADPSFQSSAAAIPPGVVVDYAGASAPAGWLLCDGSAVSRATYAALFAAIGTTYGTGDGSTTFNLPDYRGRVGVGKDNMGGSAASRITAALSGITGTTLGATGGEQAHTLTENEMPAHTHTMPRQQTGGGSTAGITTTAASTVNITTGSTGGGLPHNNVQPTIIVNKIIKI